jgi:hypothetical protein
MNDIRIKRAAQRREQALSRALAAEHELARQDRELAKLVAPLFPKHFRDGNPTGLTFSIYHECKASPVGVCLYDEYDDPARDSCLVCGDPEERK